MKVLRVKQGVQFALGAIAATTLLVAPAVAEEAQEVIATSVSEAFSEGKAYLNFRYRYEWVDQDGLTEDANASTLRSRLGFKTAKYMGLRFHGEIEDVSELGNDNYNNTINGKTDHPVVADVDGTEVNQAYLRYERGEMFGLQGGRYRLALDNVRFVGDVGWRQNNQTFDGGLFDLDLMDDKISVLYSYLANVNRIFGENSPAGDIDSSSHILHTKFNTGDYATIAAYGYLIDLPELAGSSSATYGAHVWGAPSIGEDLSLKYDAEYAYQQDYEDNPTDYSANYYRGELGVGFNIAHASIGYEVLGSDDGKAGFSTPLATLHAWNGWADKFLTTPAAGLQDTYAKVGVSFKEPADHVSAIKLDAVYHNFESDEGSVDYGDEIDLNFWVALDCGTGFGVKWAHYNADTHSADTDKVIFSLTKEFSQ